MSKQPNRIQTFQRFAQSLLMLLEPLMQATAKNSRKSRLPLHNAGPSAAADSIGLYGASMRADIHITRATWDCRPLVRRLNNAR
jgi:hypothetical protein